jgi:hypothetical protein
MLAQITLSRLVRHFKQIDTVEEEEMQTLHMYAAWIGIFLGFVAGTTMGLFFHNESWLGGYSSWSRRMVRLGHISFFGIALINLAYALSLTVASNLASAYASVLFIFGAITMPLVCFLSAYKKKFRHLFFIPVLSLVIGTLFILKEGV